MSLRLLIEATIGGTMYRLSNEHIYDLTNRWYGFIGTFDTNWRLTTRYGGYRQFKIASISISTNAWDDLPSAPAWPPTQLITLSIYYTLSTEAAKVLITNATGYRTQMDGEYAYYTLYPDNDNVYVLREEYTKTNVTVKEINDGLAATPLWRWQLSGSGTSEYYLQTAGGANPAIGEPNRLYRFGREQTIGTVGSLAAGEWDWADNDALGYSTVYFRTSTSADPDTLSTGQVCAHYGTTSTPVPRAFGEVGNRPLIELPPFSQTASSGRYWLYDMADIRGTQAKAITGMASGGGALTTVTSTAHGFSNGDTVYIEITPGDYYNNSDVGYVISNVAANTFDIPRIYTSTRTGGIAYKTGYWRVYDNNVPFTSCFATYYTSPKQALLFCYSKPSGVLTMSGRGYNDAGSSATNTLALLTAHVAGALGYANDTTAARSPSTPLNFWQTEQKPIMEFFGDVLGYATHCGWDNGSTVYIKDIVYTSGGYTAYTEFNAFENVSYTDENIPLGKIMGTTYYSKWDENTNITQFEQQTADYYFADVVSVPAYNYIESEVNAELTRIAFAYQCRNVTMTSGSGFYSSLPDPCDYLYLVDNYYTGGTSYVIGHVHALEFDFDADTITIVVKQGTAVI